MYTGDPKRRIVAIYLPSFNSETRIRMRYLELVHSTGIFQFQNVVLVSPDFCSGFYVTVIFYLKLVI